MQSERTQLETPKGSPAWTRNSSALPSYPPSSHVRAWGSHQFYRKELLGLGDLQEGWVGWRMEDAVGPMGSQLCLVPSFLPASHRNPAACPSPDSLLPYSWSLPSSLHPQYTAVSNVGNTSHRSDILLHSCSGAKPQHSPRVLEILLSHSKHRLRPGV